MPRYILFSVFALLLLTACAEGLTGQAGSECEFGSLTVQGKESRVIPPEGSWHP